MLKKAVEMISYSFKKTLPLLLLVFVFILLFSYKLNTIPPNVSGDETSYLNATYQILFSPHLINPFLLMEDHTKTALNFYWMGTWIKLFGLNNTIFAMRFSIVIFSIGTLIVFFELMNKRTNITISLLITLLLGTNVWFMNFARSGWLNLVSVFWGITMIYFLEKAIEKQSVKIFFLSGVFGGLSCYSYLSGYIFPISALIFLTFRIFKSKKRRKSIKQVIFYFIGFIPIILPIAIMAILIKNDFFLRPQVVFVFNNHSPFIPLLITQITEVVKGLLFLDGNSIGKGIENLRYFPANASIADSFIRILFLSGVIYMTYNFFKKPYLNIWLIIYVITLGTVGVLTDNPPNLARTILILPCIYFLSGVMLFNIINFLKKIIGYRVAFLIVIPIVLLISYTNVSSYFKWSGSEEVAYYRQPAIDYYEFSVWQEYQINLIRNGKRPIVNQEWYQIRNYLLK